MSKWLKRIYLVLIYGFLYAPILVLMFYSFNAGKTRGKWEGFSFHWYQELMQNGEILSALRNTLVVAVIATLIATVIGTLGAIGIHEFRGKAKRSILGINQIPVTNPDIVMAVGLMVLFRTIHLDFGYLSLIMAHVAFTTPYVLLSVLPKLRQMPRALPEAAMDLGATPWQTLRMVILPQIRSGVVAGALMAFTLSIDDFVISFFTTGNGVETVSTIVYSMAKRGINPQINALSTIMFGVMLLLLIAENIYSARKEKYRS